MDEELEMALDASMKTDAIDSGLCMLIHLTYFAFGKCPADYRINLDSNQIYCFRYHIINVGRSWLSF